jgi:hemolysin D
MSDAQLTPRIRSALFEITSGEPQAHPRLLLWLICLLFGTLVLWAIFAKLDIVAVAEGKLVPETYVKIVQPSESGIVREILVTEGQRVKRGQVLLRLDQTLAAADKRSVGSQLALKRLELRRIDAQLLGRPLNPVPEDDPLLLAQVRLDAAARERAHLDEVAREEAFLKKTESELLSARETLAKLERTLPSFEASAQAYEHLARDKLVGALTADEKRREAIERAQDLKSQSAYVASLHSALDTQHKKIEQIVSSYRSTLQSERVQVLAEVNRLSEEATKQGFREGLLELRAPQEGVVKELATTTVGAVVQPGSVLISLVPQNEALVGEVFIKNEDIGFVRKGQPVRIKLAAYPFAKYGMLEGTVQTIGADAAQLNAHSSTANDDSQTERSAAAFKAVVRLSRQKLETTTGIVLPLAAGMQLSAEIREGQRSVLEYLLSPVRKTAHEASRER